MKKKILLAVLAGMVLVSQGNLLGRVSVFSEEYKKTKDYKKEIEKWRKEAEKIGKKGAKRLKKRISCRLLDSALFSSDTESIEQIKTYEDVLAKLENKNIHQLKYKHPVGLAGPFSPLQFLFWVSGDFQPEPFTLYLLLNHYLNTAEYKDIQATYPKGKAEGQTILHRYHASSI